MSPNKDFIDYLKKYCEPSHTTDFAILLDGPWGSGKTHFVHNHLKKAIEAQGYQLAYVSLNGVSTIEQVSSALLSELFPWRHGKLASFIKKSAAATLTKGLASDFYGDEGADVTLVADLDGVLHGTPGKKGKTPKLLVFDDLERANLRPSEVLGFINNLLEQDNAKVVLVANEEELRKSGRDTDNDVNDYNIIKEKAIAKTFGFQIDVNKAFDELLDLNSSESVTQLREFKTPITEVFRDAKCSNLRLMRQAISNITFFLETVNSVCHSNGVTLNLDSLCIEIAKGITAVTIGASTSDKLKYNDFTKQGRIHEAFYGFEDNSEQSALTKLKNDHYGINWVQLEPLTQEIAHVVFKGLPTSSGVELGLKKLDVLPKSHKTKDHLEALNNIFYLPEKEVTKTLNSVMASLGKKNPKRQYSVFELKDIVTAFARLIELDISSHEMAQLYEAVSSHLRQSCQDESYEEELIRSDLDSITDAMHYSSEEVQAALRNFEKLCIDQRESSIRSRMSKAAQKVKTADEQVNKLAFYINEYPDRPFLNYIDVKDLLTKVLDTTNGGADLINLWKVLNQRYQSSIDIKKIKEEKEFAGEMIREIDEMLKNGKLGSMNTYRLKRIHEELSSRKVEMEMATESRGANDLQ